LLRERREFDLNQLQPTSDFGQPLFTSFVFAMLPGNSLDFPVSVAFDGQRILMTNKNGNSVSLWKATDLAPLGGVLEIYCQCQISRIC
jgi:hypothetical protein